MTDSTFTSDSESGSPPATAFGQAVRAVLPVWLALCAIAFAWGVTMQIVPGMMEGSRFYPTYWAANLAHYDPHSYLLVAETGYGAEGRYFQSSVRFPLFPMLTRLSVGLTGVDGYVAMFAISKLALLAGLVGLHMLAAHVLDREHADRAVLYMAYPLLGSGYAWLMSYPEALHLALWTFGFLLFFRRQYYLCGLLTVLAVWTRPQAAFVVPVFALALLAEQIQARGVRGLLDGRLWLRGLLACGLPLLAFSAWVLHISALTDLPLSPVTGLAEYGRDALVWPWERAAGILLQPLTEPGLQYNWKAALEYYQIIVIALSFAVLVAAALRRRLPWPLLLFTALTVLIPLSTHINSIGRYALLSWLPLAAVYAIPKRYDSAVVPLGAALGLLVVVVTGLTTGFNP